MSGKPKLIARTPDEKDMNSLIANRDDIIEDPQRRRYAIVEVATEDIRRLVASGEVEVRVKLVHIEQMEGSDEEKAQKLLDAAFKRRTGHTTRPVPYADTELELPADAAPDED